MFILSSSFFLLVASIGLLVTVTPLKATLLGFSSLAIGVIGSAYFAGMLAGSLMAPALIRRAGHIRAHAGFVALAIAGALLMPILVGPWEWAVIRVVTGFAAAGLYVVAEAWIVSSVSDARRGQALALFQIVYYGGSAFGQQLLILDETVTWQTFSLAAILLAGSIPPLCFAAAAGPAVWKAPRLRLTWLYSISPVGVLGALMVGFAASSIWALMPVTASHLGYSPAEVGAIMTAIIVGGAALQLPVGWLSDRIDRRWVLLCAAIPALALAVLIWFLGRPEIVVACLLTGAMGGTTLVQYAVSVAHANDRAGPEHAIEISSALLLIYCVGAVLGPVLATGLTKRDPADLFLFIGAVQAMFAVFIVYRMTKRGAPSAGAKFSDETIPPGTKLATSSADE